MNTRNRIFGKLAAVVAAAGLLMPAAVAQETISFDEAFVRTALEGDAYEILSSELALERSDSEEVQAFARQMIEAHTASSQRLNDWAGEHGIEAPFETGAAHGILMQSLHQLEGESFDGQYLLQLRAVHRMALMQHQIAVDMIEDGDLREIALQNVDAIAQHLMQLESVMASMGIEDPHDQILGTQQDAATEEAPADGDAPAEEEAPTDETPEEPADGDAAGG